MAGSSKDLRVADGAVTKKDNFGRNLAVGAAIGAALIAFLLTVQLFDFVWHLALDRDDLFDYAVNPFGARGGIPAWYRILVSTAAIVGLVWGGWALFRSRVEKKELEAATDGSLQGEFDKKKGWSDPRRLDIRQSASAMVAKAPFLRPELAARAAAHGQAPHVSALAYTIGRSAGRDVYVSVQDTASLFGPTGSGKGLRHVNNIALSTPQSLVTTTTKTPDWRISLKHRASMGKVWTFNPQGLGVKRMPFTCAWDIIDGCEEPDRAGARATGLTANSKIKDDGQNAEWRGFADGTVQACLHAAAVQRDANRRRGLANIYQGATMREVKQWCSGNGQYLRFAERILRSNPNHFDCGEVCEFATDLAALHQSDFKYLSSVMSVVRQSMAPLKKRSLLEALTPSPERPAFRAEDIIENVGTLYLAATRTGKTAAAGFVTALIEDIQYIARERAMDTEAGRLEPGIMFLLDECANVAATIPSLPVLMADGRSIGLTTTAVFQDFAQLQAGYGQFESRQIWSNSMVKIVLGGIDDPESLRNISDLLGELDELVKSESTDEGALGKVKSKVRRSVTKSLRIVKTLTPQEIADIPEGRALLRIARTGNYPLESPPYTQHPNYQPCTSEEAVRLLCNMHGVPIPAKFRDSQQALAFEAPAPIMPTLVSRPKPGKRA